MSLAGDLNRPRGELDPVVGGESLEQQRGGEVFEVWSRRFKVQQWRILKGPNPAV
uniref:Uncharacterized protein n=1 Tax=Brassica campestris TaxID=3711 RepID=M4DSK8_BRACM